MVCKPLIRLGCSNIWEYILCIHLGCLMWEKQCHKPAMTGNGKTTTYKMVMIGGWFYCFAHINLSGDILVI
jgi:hypothetical protein